MRQNIQFFENYDFVWAFCRYFWEGHVKLPIVDEALLIKRNVELQQI